jgi:hypothetical protein
MPDSPWRCPGLEDGPRMQLGARTAYPRREVLTRTHGLLSYHRRAVLPPPVSVVVAARYPHVLENKNTMVATANHMGADVVRYHGNKDLQLVLAGTLLYSQRVGGVLYIETTRSASLRPPCVGALSRRG